MNQPNTFEAQEIVWQPTPEVIERAQLTRFMKQIGVSTFDELYKFSISKTEKFTAEVLKFLDIKFDPPYEKLLDLSDGIEFPHWCVGGGLNIVSHCVDRWQMDEMRDQPAVIWEGEGGFTETLTYGELFRQVRLFAAVLRSHGFGKGDAVGIHLPMLPATVAVLLAIGRIGAIAVPVFSGYGVEAIASRMNAVGAKALITCVGFQRRGKQIYAEQTALEAAERCPTIEKFFSIVQEPKTFGGEKITEMRNKAFAEYKKFSNEEKIEQQKKIELERELEEARYHEAMKTPKELLAKMREDREQDMKSGGVSFRSYKIDAEPNAHKIRKAFWKNLLKRGEEHLETLSHLEPTEAEDPLIILYTSGTTGKPKGIAHTHCSFPIKAAQDMAYGTDVGRGTRISWITDIGWMMGPWLIYGALINGATICIYDGAPDYPEADRMWEFCAKHRVEILGISPTLVRALATKGDDLPKKHDLSSLRAFASTGEPWNPAPWWWLFEKVGNSKLPIINYSGGTEISGGILMNNPLVPIKPCSFSAPCLGIEADILDDTGKSVGAGSVGELAIRKPWIGMARGFWQERERYLETYWNRFADIWVHGDWAMKDADGHWFILGRSDDTLKVAGKRVGPAEVESLLVAHPLVAESAVIGIPDEMKGTAMVAFCVLQTKTKDASALASELKQLVTKDMGKPLAPSRIHFVSALPKTRNAKVMRRVIRAAYLREDAGDLSALENPAAVEEIKQCGNE
ncbi:MAG: AMP-binding protein [Acidobacteria bacterium]|nr:AMP-binding protein [Acidobacteriota bacterium]